MRCRHLNTSDKCGETTHDRIGDIIYEVEYRECLDCGAWLPLGESNDKPEAVRVEIRAAELAAEFTRERGTADDATVDENAGWLVHLNEWTHLDRDRGFPKNDEQHAGYLAREIATHSEES